MRSKLVLAALLTLITSPLLAQVAPAVKIGGLPIGIGAGLSDYSIDYGSGRRMLGISAWGDYNVFHGLGVEVEGQSIFADRPSDLCTSGPRTVCQMKQDSIKGGIIYKARAFKGVRPYAKVLGGIGEIYFPSHNFFYSQDSFTTYGAGGGLEYRVWKTLSVRADYEYQFYEQFLGKGTLNPNGVTVGATYYLRGIHRHY
jgi:opacity protein-like surface antigen